MDQVRWWFIVFTIELKAKKDSLLTNIFHVAVFFFFSHRSHGTKSASGFGPPNKTE